MSATDDMLSENVRRSTMAKYDLEAIHDYMDVILFDEELSNDRKVEMLKKVVKKQRSQNREQPRLQEVVYEDR